jgi:Leucine-rich repeat (LRR) protein
MKKLTSLTLRGLRVAELPIGGLPLEDLELFDCKLARPPAALAKLRRLTELTLVDVRAPLPGGLRFPKLERLELSNVGGGLREVPPFVLGARSLHNVSLHNNRIRELPSAFEKLTELRFLSLEHNKLRALPDIFDSLPRLDTLLLEGNALSRLPDSIGALRTKLTMLSLGQNPLAKDAAERARIKKLLPKTKIYWR